jgi:ABC-type bacteriocin/lantibiotic exporter with double-glycine peptidase domain
VDPVAQLEVTECGAASLAMVLGYHGHHANLAELRQDCGASGNGTRASDLIAAARGRGLEARAVRLALPELAEIPLPAVLHWDFNHYLVLERISRRRAVLVDPASGRRALGWPDLGRHFTGIALLFQPGPAFRRRRRTWPSLARYRKILRTSLPSLAQLVLAAAALQVVALVFPVANQLLLDRVIVPRQPAWLWGLALGLGLAVLARTLLGLIQGWVALGLQVRLERRLSGDFLDHLLRLPLAFFLRRGAGDLAQRLQGYPSLGLLLGSPAVLALFNGALLIGYAGLMLAYQLRLGLLVLALGLARAGLFLLFRSRQRQRLAMELEAAGREASARVEALTGFETTRACAAGDRMLRHWGRRLITRIDSGLARQRLALGAAALTGLAQAATTLAVLRVGGAAVLERRMTLGVFIAFLTLEGLFMGPLEALLAAATRLQQSRGQLRRLDEVLETPAEPAGARDPGRLAGAIVCADLQFGPVPGRPPLLRGLSFHLEPGEQVALTGPSGAGKSTLVRLLLGLEQPEAGTLQFDGRDLCDLDRKQLRRQMGVVLQEPFLLDDTVRANLCLRQPNLPLEPLRRAARLACVDEVIEALPQGYDTRIGPNGALLSGGQRQRLCLARALVHAPRILLLDEATSCLDLDTERRIHGHLATLGCTRLVIAHRSATLLAVDRVLVLDGGRIIQDGRPDELRLQPGPFQDLLAAGGGHG